MIRRLRTGSLVLNTGNNKKKTRIVLLPAQIILIFFLLTNVLFIVITGSGSRDGPNVIIIVIDALREDTLGINGYLRNTSPNIDEFAGNSIVFKNSYSSSSWTKPSVSSLFSSMNPLRHNVLGRNTIMPDKIHTIAEVLKNHGYRTFFLGGGNPFAGRKFNLDQGFDFYFNKRTNADKLTSKFISLLPQLKEGSFFSYIHFMDLHLPYNKNKLNYFFSSRGENAKFIPGRIKLGNVRRLARNDDLSENDKIDMRALYDGQLKYVDENIGKLLMMLKNESLIDKTYLIITSDHGEEFWDHGAFEHGHTLYNELIRVPLIIGGNGIKPSIKINSVRNIDIFPTILNFTNIPFKCSNSDGSSLKMNLLKEERIDRPVFSTGLLYGKNKYTLIINKKKIILNSKKTNTNRESEISKKRILELYDMLLDPKEKTNLAGAKRVAVSKLIRSLRKYMRVKPFTKQKNTVVDEKTWVRLKTLGYL